MSTTLIPDPTVHSGRPADCSHRLPREVAVYDLLDSLGVPYLQLDHEPLFTIEACHEADALLGVAMCKNLFLCNQSKTAFYLLLMPGEKRFRTKEFSRLIGSSRLSFAPEEAMESLLGLTPGSVTPLGLMNDRTAPSPCGSTPICWRRSIWAVIPASTPPASASPPGICWRSSSPPSGMGTAP